MYEKDKAKRITIRITDKQHSQIKEAAQINRMSISQYIRSIINKERFVRS